MRDCSKQNCVHFFFNSLNLCVCNLHYLYYLRRLCEFFGPITSEHKKITAVLWVWLKKNNYKHGFSCFESSTRHASKLDNLRIKKTILLARGKHKVKGYG